MELKEILSISGWSGLYKIVAKTKNGLIVESMDGSKKRLPINNTHKVSSLEEITVFMQKDTMPLKDVFANIKEKEKEAGKVSAFDLKSDNQKLKDYFKKLIPEHDERKVYVSDMKKMLSWYQILHKDDNTPASSELPVDENKQ